MTFLERLWWYVSLGAMGSFWGEASPLIGGLAAFEGRLYLIPVIQAVALGTWLGQLLFYWVGRWRGKWLRKRWPRLRPMIIRSVALVRRHPWRASLLVRFAYGVRVALPIGCGVAHLPFAIYAIGTAISCIVWALLFTLLGWGLGRTTETLIGQVRQFERFIGIALVALVVVGYFLARRRQVAQRTVRVLDPESKP